MKWQQIGVDPPPIIQKPIIMKGDSGYVDPHGVRYKSGFYDPEYRPAAPYRDWSGGSIQDDGSHPTHWMYVEDFEKLTGVKAKSTLAVGVSVLLVQKGKLLLGKRKNVTAEGLFSTPGGRIEQNENMFSCAEREFKEETGAVISSPLEVIGFKELFRFNMHYIMFYLKATAYEGEIVNNEPDKCEGWKFYSLRSLPGSCTEPQDILELLRAQSEVAKSASLQATNLINSFLNEERCYGVKRKKWYEIRDQIIQRLSFTFGSPNPMQ